MNYVVKGLLYGDEGKGTIVDYLTLSGCDVVREGGPQAAHHVVSTNNMLHRSEQMGSGIFNEGVRTFCSKNMFIIPQNIVTENIKLNEAGIYDGMERIIIDSKCPIVTPLHQMIGRLTEVSVSNKRGTTGMGVGQAVLDKNKKGNKVLSLLDITNNSVLNAKIQDLYYEKFEQANHIVEANPNNKELAKLYKYYVNHISMELLYNSYRRFAIAYPNCIELNGEKYLNILLESEKDLVFEGSQGALLDPEHGFKPYISPVKNTFNMTEELIGNKISKSNITRLGVIRAYSTRHGSGPFVSEDNTLTKILPDKYNGTNEWQGAFRIGWFDLLAVRYGIMINNNVDSIAITNLDRLSQLNNILVCDSYEYVGYHEELLDDYFEWEIQKNKIIITGFKKPNKHTDKIISNLLFECKPIFRGFSGWKQSINNTKTLTDLPTEAIKYINFLQSEDGFNKPISIISVGEMSNNKILVQ